MPKAERARAPKAGPYSRLPLPLPAAGLERQSSVEEEESCSSDDERAGSGGGAKARKRLRAGGGGAQAREHACPHCASTFMKKSHCDQHVRTCVLRLLDV